MSLAVAALLCASGGVLAAQWLDYPAPGVPKNADGTPNLDAPAPKAPGGRPDLSGIWRPERNQKCPPDGCPDNQMSEQFLDFGYGLKDGLPYQPWAAALVKQRADQNGKDDPTSHCLPGGIVRLHTYPAMNKIVQTPGIIVILSERETTYRQIFLDGRPLPVDPLPSWCSRAAFARRGSGWIAREVRSPRPRRLPSGFDASTSDGWKWTSP
jgi:hypothetical protein